MENEVVVTTLDNRIDLCVTRFDGHLRFRISTNGQPQTLANTKHYAFKEEAVDALRARGIDYADEMVGAAVAAME